MSTKKETSTQLSPEENTQVADLLAGYPQLAQQLLETPDQEHVESVLAAIFQASVPVQIEFIKALGRENRSAAADIVSALHTFSPEKEVRKEARRAIIRLESSKTYSKWKAPETPGVLAQLPTPNAPRFWKGYASTTREEGEIVLILCWEQGVDYKEVHMLSFILGFWETGVKDFFTLSGTRRRIEERIGELRGQGSVLQLSSCTLAEGKRLLQEALSVNEWRKVPLNKDFRLQLPHIKRLVLEADEAGFDSGQTFITPAMEAQELVVNFIGSWSFGDYALAYDLLSSDNPLRQAQSRDEWIEQHRAWYDEAQPTRMKLGFVHEQEADIQPDAIANKCLTEVGWSLELNDTQLGGTIDEMPMGTAVNKESGRHWFWTNYVLAKEDGAWRIREIVDEGAALQGLPVAELQERIKSYESAIDSRLEHREEDPESFQEEVAWRLTQLLHFDDALLAQITEPDYQTYQEAYEHALLTGDPERMVIYLERMNQRFPEHKADTLRRLGSTLAEMAYHSEGEETKERSQHLLARAEEILREVVSIEDNAMNRALVAELLMSSDRNDEAHDEFQKAAELLSRESVNVNLHASIEAGLGNVDMRAKRYKEAIPHYEKVAELDPTYAGVWFSLGFANRLINNRTDAETYYVQGLAMEPIDTRIYSELTAIYVQRKEYSRAQKLLEDGLKRSPETAYLHMLIASVFAESGDKRQAKRHIEEAERLDPESDIISVVRKQIEGKQQQV